MPYAYGFAALALLIWVSLLIFRHGYWRARQRLGRPQDDLVGTPSVTVLVPARNEAAHIGEVISSISKQDYPGELSVILVDDASEDGTAAAAKTASLYDLRVVTTVPLPEGWTGKLWALETGWQDVRKQSQKPDYIWLSDADIVHDAAVLTALVTKAQARQAALTSLMVRLDTKGLWAKLFIPAFIYFFQLLYPFNAVGNKAKRNAGAAGGCMLIETPWLEKIGGFASVKDALIDDCALARRVKDAGGRLWLGHGTASRSVRSNQSFGDLWAMVKRTAYAQLFYNPFLLIICLVGLGLTFGVPVLAVLFGLLQQDYILASLGAAAWLLMAFSYWPTSRLYGRTVVEPLLLPFVTMFYGLMTLHSALDHMQGRGNAWKGRAYGANRG